MLVSWELHCICVFVCIRIHFIIVIIHNHSFHEYRDLVLLDILFWKKCSFFSEGKWHGWWLWCDIQKKEKKGTWLWCDAWRKIVLDGYMNLTISSWVSPYDMPQWRKFISIKILVIELHHITLHCIAYFIIITSCNVSCGL